MNLSPNLLLSTLSIAGIAIVVVTLAGAFKEKETEYEGGIGPSPIIDDPDRPPPPPTNLSQPLDLDCKSENDCSNNGLTGGPRARLGDRIGCDRGRCTHYRKDYTNLPIWWKPSECVGQFLGRPGTCEISKDEQELRKKARDPRLSRV